MRAIICTRYGPPEVLQLQEVPKPVPKKDEVLIQVRATTVHVGDVRIRRFDVPRWQWPLARLALGLTKPRNAIPGMELAGVIESVGQDVTQFKAGDRVFAFTGFACGANAEYKCLPQDGMLAEMPDNASFEDAAAGLATGALAALITLRKADIQSGQKVLIYGASGSVGTYAVQLAKYFGSEVTGVCSTGNLEMVQSLGADHVIDYTQEDFAQVGETYHVIMDAVDKLSSSHGKKALKGTGIYLNVGKDSGSEKDTTPQDLIFLKELVEAGKLRVVIDRRYTMDQIVEAHRYVEKGHKKGHVVITVGSSDRE